MKRRPCVQNIQMDCSKTLSLNMLGICDCFDRVLNRRFNYKFYFMIYVIFESYPRRCVAYWFIHLNEHTTSHIPFYNTRNTERCRVFFSLLHVNLNVQFEQHRLTKTSLRYLNRVEFYIPQSVFWSLYYFR